MKVGVITIPLAESWNRFSFGNATKGDFEIILADLLDVCHHGQAVSFAAFLADQKSLSDYPLYTALISSKQEIGARITSLLAYSDQQIIEVRKLGRAKARQNPLD